MYVFNQYRPILFDDKGDVWMLLGNTLLSAGKHTTKMYVDFTDTNERFTYSQRKNKFVKEEVVKLTEREINILVLSSQGYISQEIAGMENISKNTVKFHKRNILTKLNVKTIAEAIIYVQSHNLKDKNNKYFRL